MSMFGPYRSSESSCHCYQVYHYIQYRNYFWGNSYVELTWIDLVNSREKHIEVDRGSEVGGAERQESQYHWKIEFYILVEKTMFWFHGIEIVVFEDVEEGKEGAIDPSSSLFH